ncbi:acyl-coenzyme A oxidase 3 [[Candida] anglica]|uniref:Acyl-coenzyme A oxidase n=1 Tax=[Candida] anglica TaxID=148631 RepID=A0ABP0EMG8_9ASCO
MSSAKNIVSHTAPPNPKELIGRERKPGDGFPLLMNQFLEGKKKSAQILRLLKSLERDPILAANFNDYEVTKEQQRELTALRINRMARYIESESIEDFNRRLNLVTVYDPSTGIRISVNLGLYINCIKGNGTDEQYKYWCIDKQAGHLNQLYGCFGMTELGHGSNVAGCETTATFDPETDEFIIDTPHIGATKWWIGGAAHSATHSSIYARLVVNGKDYGVKTFVVPLRDSNHELLPGVSIGDIGSKMGREGVDNGWIQFSDVRIPRFFMLQKFCKVSREGKVTLPPLEQLSYISLLGGRVTMATDSYRAAARFTTIAIRYGVGRKQFPPNLGLDGVGDEVQLMDYPLHQRRLFPYLALAYAMGLGTNRLENQHNAILVDLDKAVAKKNTNAIKSAINETKSLFIDSGSLKSTTTWLAADCITECRQTCGGHGYSAYSGFGKAYDDWVVQCTWEGDNNVLAMSVGKTLIRNVQEVLDKGKKIGGSVSFLSNARQYINNDLILREGDQENPDKILQALEVLIVRISSKASEALKSSATWDDVSPQRVLLSKLRCHHYLLQSFIENLREAASELQPDLNTLIRLYANTFILEAFSSEFLIYGVIDAKTKNILSSEYIPKLCLDLRPRAITLTDSFQQSDMILNSAIGKYNGDIYENYFNVVKDQNPPIKTKAFYSESMEAMLSRPSLEDRDRQEKTESAQEILTVPFPKRGDDDEDDDDDDDDDE